MAIWSTRDPVSLFGAAGSASGTEEVRCVQDWVAGHFAGLVEDKQELVAAGACGDLAYTVAFEHKTVDTSGGGAGDVHAARHPRLSPGGTANGESSTATATAPGAR